jgi:uncharacterized protein (TIGR00251 family)
VGFWFRRDGPDIILHVQILPRARTDAVAGVTGDRLKVRIAAPPVEGRANEHLLAYLAKLFGVPKSNVMLQRGAASRRKVVRIHSPKKLPPDLDWTSG